MVRRNHSERTFSCLIIGDDTLTIQCAGMLWNQGHEICGIVSQNPEIGRWANKHKVPYIESFDNLTGILGQRSFDYLFSIANLRVLPKEVLALPRAGTINFHDGLLPRYAGIHATSWALINQEHTHGITWHFINDLVDGGKILKQRPITISEGETGFSLNTKCLGAGIESFTELIDELSKGTAQPREQDLSKRSYFGMWQRPDAAGIISWHRTAREIDALVRALDFGPHPNAMGRAKIAIGSDFVICREIEVLDGASGVEPGTIRLIDADRIRVAAAQGEVGITRFEKLCGGAMSAKDVAEQYGLQPGMKLVGPDDLEREEITRLTAEVCRYEGIWVKRLAALQPPSLPYLEMTTGGQEGASSFGIDIAVPAETLTSLKAQWLESNVADIVAGAFSLYLARVSGEGRFDLGFACAGITGLFAIEVPWPLNIDCDASARAQMSYALKALETTRKRKTYLLDLWTRHPELRAVTEKSGVPVFPIQVELQQAGEGPQRAFDQPLPDGERRGSALTLLVSNAGKCRMVCRAAEVKLENGRLMAGQFGTFLEALSRDPEKPVAEMPLLTNSERERLLFGWNNTAAPFPDKCKPHLFEEQVVRTPNAIAVAFKEEQLTYAELNARANQLARHLRKLGVGPDVVTAICIERSIEMIVGLLGIQKAGGAYLPLDPTYPKERLGFILEDAKVRVLVTEERLVNSLPPHESAVVRLDADRPQIALEESTNFESGVRPHHLAYVIYTSGSTGKPKGVMIEHRNVVSFFTGMDARIPHEPGNVWLAVTSVSFDISVLELFWTLSRGFKIVIYPREQRLAASAPPPVRSIKPMDYSLFYFSADQGENPSDKYRLLLEGAKFADQNGFTAVWTPERHFHAFGGLYPNPSVTSAALATITKNVQLRSGSVVAPLHSPIRIAEEWSLVDNLSGGRVGLSFASGWMPEDFVIRPDDFADRKDATFRSMETVRRLWRGEAVDFRGPLGKDVSIRTLPRPIQKELPVWITTAGNPETYQMAANAGANVLTHLLGQTIDDVGEKIALYRKAWKQAGHPGHGHVTLMLHTFVGESQDIVRETVRQPLITYLRTSTDLLKKYSSAFPAFKNKGDSASQINFGDLPPEEMEAVLQFAFARYFETSGLFGTPDSCLEMVEKLKSHGVDEIACLVDFGISVDAVLKNLKYLNVLRAATSRPSAALEAPHTDESIGGIIRRHGVTHFQCTPSMARMLLAEDETRGALQHLQVIMIGGEAFSPSLAKELRHLVTGRIINMYGPTETTIWSSTYELNGDAHSIPIGHPILNTQFYVVNRLFQPQPVGVPGELWIGGAGVARGYLNRNELTAERLLLNPFVKDKNARVYRTGDLVRYMADGNIEFLGRIDHQVKIRGHRIELGEIESVLNRHAAVREAVVIARQDAPEEVRLIAYVTGRNGHKLNASELRDYVQEHLPEYMVPARVVQLESFPQTPNKKVDRKALPAPSKIESEVKRDVQPPEGPIESKLAEIWADVLGIHNIGRKDDFFSLGGDSLSLVQVTLKTEEILGKKLSIAAFVQARTLEQVAKLLGQTVVKQDAEGATATHKVKEIKSPIRQKPSDEPQANANPPHAGTPRHRLKSGDEVLSVGIRNRLLQILARVAPEVWRVRLHKWRGVSIGDNVSIGYDTVIETAYPWLVSIGDNVNIGMRVTVIGHYGENVGIIDFQGMTAVGERKTTVQIQKDAYIGPGVIILPNVIIGNGAVVAAGSVVNCDIPPMTLVQGNPARPVARCGVTLGRNTTYEEFTEKLQQLSA